MNCTELWVPRTGEGLRNSELMLLINCVLHHFDQGSSTGAPQSGCGPRKVFQWTESSTATELTHSSVILVF